MRRERGEIRRETRSRPPLAAGAALLLLAAAAPPAMPAPPIPAAPAPPLPPAAGIRLSPSELSRLAAGEVVVRRGEAAPGAPGAPRERIGTGLIDLPPARVFAALADFAHWSEFMPFMRRSEARRGPDGSFLCDQSLDLPGGLRHYRVRAVARPAEGAAENGAEAVWRIAWSYVPGSGNIATQSGSWTLLPYGGRTLAVLRLAADPGGLFSGLAERATEKSIPWIFNGLRQHAGRGRYASAPPPATPAPAAGRPASP